MDCWVAVCLKTYAHSPYTTLYLMPYCPYDVRYGLSRDTTIPFGKQQMDQGLQCIILPLDFDFKPHSWMEPIQADGMEPLYMSLLVGPICLERFPANWRKKRYV